LTKLLAQFPSLLLPAKSTPNWVNLIKTCEKPDLFRLFFMNFPQ